MALTLEPKNTLLDRSLISVVLVTALAFTLAIAMLPGTEEQAAVYSELGRYHDAIAVLEAAQAGVGLTPFESYSLAELYEHVGRVEDLEALLRAEIARDPSTTWAYAKLNALEHFIASGGPSGHESGTTGMATFE